MRILLASILLFVSTLAAANQEVFVWDKKPIDLVLTVGVQKIVSLPDHARVQVPQHLSDQVEIVPVNGAVYFTARDELASTAIRLELVNSGQFIMLNLTAKANLENNPQFARIVLANSAPVQSAESVTTQNIPSFMTSGPITNVALARFVLQQYWVPPRLKPGIPAGVTQVKSVDGVDLTNLFGFCSLDRFKIAIADTFKTNDGRYATSLLLENKTAGKQFINLTHLRIQHIFSATYPETVYPLGTAGSYSTLVIITDVPFLSALSSEPSVLSAFGAAKGC